jgi:hypothetical protein
MPRKRKTAAQLRDESYAADRRAWEDFLPKLQSVESYQGAIRLLAAAVPSGASGRGYYSNLGFFMQTFRAPDGANASELSEYLRLIDVFDVEGVLKPGVRPQLDEDLKRALMDRNR